MLSNLEEAKEQEIFKNFKKIEQTIYHHDHSTFDKLCLEFKYWTKIHPKVRETTYGEFALKKSVVASNEQAFNFLLHLDADHNYFITKSRNIAEIFLDAIIDGSPYIVDNLIKRNPSLLNTRNYEDNGNHIATVIRTVTAQNIMRYGKFKSERVKEKFLNWFIGVEENLELFPGEEVIEFYGPIGIVNMLLSHKVDFWSMDQDGIAPYDAIKNPDDPKYQKWFRLELNPFKNLTFFQHNGEAQLSLRGTQEISDRNYEKDVTVTIEYHFSQLRAILEKARMSAAFENALSNQKIQQLEQQVQGLNIKNFMQDHYIKQTAAQLQKVEMEVTPVVQKNQETLQWEARKRMVDSQALTQLFCERVDYRLRSCINASIVLASGNVQREKGSVEGVLTETLNMIADCMGVFANVTLKLIAKGIEVGMDWRNEKLFKATAKLFAFSDPNMVSDRTAIAITEICTPLLQQSLTKEAEVKKYADKTVAFLMYLMSHEQLVKQSENPIENQLIDNFAKSELLTKYRLEFDKKEQEVLAQEQQSFDKQQKKKEGSGGFKILSFKSPWKKSSKDLNNGNNDNASEQMVLSYNQKPSLVANIT